MKRPTFALLSLLALLALGLIAAGPNCSEAGSLGELAFAIAIEETDAGDPIVCPRVCCPLEDEYDCCDQPTCDEAAMELNAAQTSDAPARLADDERDDFDYDAYYGDYGFEYGDEYDPYSEEDIAGETVESESDAVATDDMELNAAETCDDGLHADGCFDEYFGEYAYEYTEHGCDYSPASEDEVSSTNDACHDAARDPIESTCETGVRSQIRESDLVVDEAPAFVDPFDAYGHQVGDDYDHYEEDYYYEYDDYSDEAADDVAQESAEDDATADATSEVEDSYYEEYYDDDYGDGYDENGVDEYEDDYERYYSEEFYDQLDETAPAIDEPATVDDSQELDAYTSDYDAIYDEAVYGDPHAAANACRYDVATPPMVVDETTNVDQSYLCGNCIDESNCEIIDDLPWADELEIAAIESTNADVSELDVPELPAPEPACGEASEYGSDYAEEYYEEFYESLDEELIPLEEAEAMPESADCHEHLLVAAAMNTLGGIDIVEFVSYLGRGATHLADSLSSLGSVVRTACDDMGPLTRTR